MKNGDSKLQGRARDNEAVRIQKRNNKYLFLVIVSMLSYSLYNMFFNHGNQAVSLFINPFNSDSNIKSNFLSLAMMFLMTIIMYLYHFGKMSRKYIQKLEKMKQKLFNFMPFYFTGQDERNLYLRFGLEESLMNSFVERKIHKQNYLNKASYLSVFIGDFSPHTFFKSKDKDINISKYFNNDGDYLDIFKIIEGYLIDNKNIDIFQNNLKLEDFKAIGSFSPRYTKESIKYFLKNCTKDVSFKKFETIFRKKDLNTKKKNEEIKNLIISEFGEKGFVDYKTDVSKMVVFSARALQEFLEKVHVDATAYLFKIKLFKTKAYENMLSYGELDEEKMLEIMVFCHFFKVINLFMGLPSGIVTARISDYHFSRILDDLEHFEESIGIREIKRKINDKNSKFDDTFPRSFMIFYHDYYSNSKNRNALRDIFIRFNPLVSLDVADRNTVVPTSFGSYVETANEKPMAHVLPSEKDDIETLKKEGNK